MIGSTHLRHLLLLGPIGLALGSAPQALAQAYKYIDDSGRVDLTDSLAAVPVKYRSQIEVREMPEQPGSTGGGAGPPDPSAESGLVAAFWHSFDASIAGRPKEEQEMLRGWARSYLLPILVTGILSGLVGIAMTIHALTQRRFLWALGNFFIGLPVGIYLLAKLENQPVLVRLFLFGVWVAPLVIWTLSLQHLTRAAAA